MRRGISRTTLWCRCKKAEQYLASLSGQIVKVRIDSTKVVVTQKNSKYIPTERALLEISARRRRLKESKTRLRKDKNARQGVNCRAVEQLEQKLCAPLSKRCSNITHGAFVPVKQKLALIEQTFNKCRLWKPLSPGDPVDWRLGIDATIKPRLTHICVAPTNLPKVHSCHRVHSVGVFKGKEELKTLQSFFEESNLEAELQPQFTVCGQTHSARWLLTADHVGHQVMSGVMPACTSSANHQQCPWCNQTYKQRKSKKPFQTWEIRGTNRPVAVLRSIPPIHRVPCLLHGGKNLLGWLLDGTVAVLKTVQHGGGKFVERVIRAAFEEHDKWTEGTLSISATETFIAKRMYQLFCKQISDCTATTQLCFKAGKPVVKMTVFEALLDMWNSFCISYTSLRKQELDEQDIFTISHHC